MYNLTGEVGNICYHLSGGYRYHHRRDGYILTDDHGVIATFNGGELHINDAERYKHFQSLHKPYPFDGGVAFAD